MKSDIYSFAGIPCPQDPAGGGVGGRGLLGLWEPCPQQLRDQPLGKRSRAPQKEPLMLRRQEWLGPVLSFSSTGHRARGPEKALLVRREDQLCGWCPAQARGWHFWAGLRGVKSESPPLESIYEVGTVGQEC